jgi:hypothetical protein
MKVVTYIVIGLLVAVLAGGTYAYLFFYKPMGLDYEKLKAGQPEFDRARRELTKCREREKAETAWTGPVAEMLRRGFNKEITEGKAEVSVSVNRVVLNVAEAVFYTPHSVTFAKDSQPALAMLATLLKDIKDRDISVGMATVPAPAQGKGRKKVPAKDARTLAAGRTLELVKYLVKNGVADSTLIAAAYPARMPDRGFKLKGEKVVIIVSAPVAAEPSAAGTEKPDTKAAASTKATQPPAAAPQIKTIPISTVPPKKVQ